ncbi:unnamed protein product [Parajaminaea phylloscopi]
MVRFSAAALLALVSCIAPSILAADHHDAVMLAKRDRAMSKLTPYVRNYLSKLDPSEYELNLDDDEDEDDDRDFAKRQQDAGSGVWYGCKNNQVAITYDDGAYQWRPKLDSMWNGAGHKVTYFVNGYNYDCAYNAPYVSYNRKSLAAGNVIGAHSWGHYNFSAPGTSHAVIDKQVELIEEMLLKTVGIVPRYFRFPYGAFSQETAQYIRSKYGYRIIQWSDDSGDSSGAPASQSIAMYKKFKKGESHLVLNHETHQSSVDTVAPAAISTFKSKGIKSVTVDQCIGASTSPYKVRTKPQARDSTWTCDGKPRPGQAN